MATILFRKTFEEIIKEDDVHKKWRIFQSIEKLYLEKRYEIPLIEFKDKTFKSEGDDSISIAQSVLVPESYISGGSVVRYINKTPKSDEKVNDADIFIVAKDIKELKSKHDKILENLFKLTKYTYRIQMINNVTTIFGYDRKLKFKIQIIHSLYENKTEILHNFDIHASQAMVDIDGKIFMTFGYILSMATQTIPIFKDRACSTYCSRLWKYQREILRHVNIFNFIFPEIVHKYGDLKTSIGKFFVTEKIAQKSHPINDRVRSKGYSYDSYDGDSNIPLIPMKWNPFLIIEDDFSSDIYTKNKIVMRNLIDSTVKQRVKIFGYLLKKNLVASTDFKWIEEPTEEFLEIYEKDYIKVSEESKVAILSFSKTLKATKVFRKIHEKFFLSDETEIREEFNIYSFIKQKFGSIEIEKTIDDLMNISEFIKTMTI